MPRRSKRAEGTEEEAPAQPQEPQRPRRNSITWRSGPLAGTPVMGEEQQRQAEEAEAERGAEEEAERAQPAPQAAQPAELPPPPAESQTGQLPEPIEQLRQRLTAVRELTGGRDEMARLAEAARLVQYFKQIGVDVDPQLVLKAIGGQDDDEADMVRLARELLKYRELARLVEALDPDSGRRREVEEVVGMLAERLDRIESALKGEGRGYPDLEALDRMVELIKKVNEYQAQIAQAVRPPEGWVGAVASVISALRPILDMIRVASTAQGGQAPELPRPP